MSRLAGGAVLPLLLALGGGAWALQWTAPDGERSRTNPVPDSPAARQKGRALYQKHCASCHGDKGKGDGPAAAFNPGQPPDLTDAELQGLITDGEMLWKITVGRKDGVEVLMPAMTDKVPVEEDRWKLVLFVRSLAVRP